MADTSGARLAIRQERSSRQNRKSTPVPTQQKNTGLLSRTNASESKDSEDTFYSDLILRIQKNMGDNNDDG